MSCSFCANSRVREKRPSPGHRAALRAPRLAGLGTVDKRSSELLIVNTSEMRDLPVVKFKARHATRAGCAIVCTVNQSAAIEQGRFAIARARRPRARARSRTLALLPMEIQHKLRRE